MTRVYNEKKVLISGRLCSACSALELIELFQCGISLFHLSRFAYNSVHADFESMSLQAGEHKMKTNLYSLCIN